MPGHKRKRLGLAAPGNGSWEQFQPGNTIPVKHGTYSHRFYSPVAEVITSELLAIPGLPQWLTDPSYAHAVRAWAVAEAKLLLIEEYMESLPPAAQFTAKGAQAPVVMHWKQLSEHAARLRARLGLDPVSRVQIGKALTSAGLDLARMSAENAAVLFDAEPA